MKAYVKILIIVMVTCGLIAWIRNSFDFGHIAKTLPFCGGSDVPLSYTLGSIFLLLLMFWGFCRLRRLGNKDDDRYEDSPDDYETDYEYQDNSYYEED